MTLPSLSSLDLDSTIENAMEFMKWKRMLLSSLLILNLGKRATVQSSLLLF